MSILLLENHDITQWNDFLDDMFVNIAKCEIKVVIYWIYLLYVLYLL